MIIIDFNSWLPYLDLSIIYLFCTFQFFYNLLTIIKIKNSRNKVSIKGLVFSYAFWTYPIIYSIWPMTLAFGANQEFGLFMLYLRIPPIAITALIIAGWTIYIPFHNKKVDTLKNIINSTFLYRDDNFAKILNSKNFFKKGIVKTNAKYLRRIDAAKNQEELLKVVAEIQGWFIGKDKFSWMWLNKKEATQQFYTQIFENVCFKSQEKIRKGF